MLEDLTPIKNDQRPYSADFVIPSLLSTKSKETLTDGSFESIYVPLDSDLPSSNLFKKLLEEDVDQWRSSDVKPSTSVNLVKDDDQSPKSNSILVVIGEGEPDNFEEKVSARVDQVIENPTVENIPEEIENGSEVSDENFNSTDIFTGTKQSIVTNMNRGNEEVLPSVKNEQSGDKYNLTPGLTTKPPIPKKITNLQPIESNKMNNDAIYDFFAIKYNIEHRKSISLAGNAEKPMCEEILVKVGTQMKEIITHKEPDDNNIGNDEIQNNDTVNISNSNFTMVTSLNSAIQEHRLNTEHLKELEVSNISKEIMITGNEKLNDIPHLSEIDIDELFKLGGENKVDENHEVLNENEVSLQSLHYTTDKKSEKDLSTDLKKQTERKCIPSKKGPSTKIHDKDTVDNKQNKSKKSHSKTKFIAAPIKLPKASESPRHKEHVFEDNIESWISSSKKKTNVQCRDFTELISTVEDLKNTTDVRNTEIPIMCTTPKLDEEKQVDFDDIETIIEALEYQDKASQNNIKIMKKIVTTELSNSMILSEDENNLKYKKKKEIAEDIYSGILSPLNDNDSGLVSPAELHPDCSRTTSVENFQEEDHTKNDLDEQEIIQAVGTSRNNVTEFANPLERVHNYKELLTYLDEVDKKCTKTLEVARERAQTASQPVLESSNLFDTMPKMEDLLSHTQEELASYVIDISLRVKDKTSCITLLQNELSSLREKLLTQTNQAENNLRHKLKEQKEETERIAKRHQKFIDQLMEEKKTFARRCEELVDEMTAMEEKYVNNMRAIEHKHNVEMQKMKDMHAASEKLRRDRWIEGRTQKIKEMAVKSIEPEVERMEKRHQEEISNLRNVHKREIEELELRAARKLQEHSETLREHLIQDREKALAHERDVMRLRYEKMVESEERSYQEQRRRLLADHANRVSDCEQREAQAAADKERAIKQAQEEFEEKLQAAARRHANEVKLVKESVLIELENWKNSFKKKQLALLMEKETSIRQECRKERDREIEIVIERLESEANNSKIQLEHTTENRIKRLREKYEAEIRDLEMLEKDSQNKYSECRSKLLEYEDAILNLRTTMKQLEIQLTDEKLKRSKLESEREEIRKTIRKEYEDKIQRLEREVEELRTSADKQVEQLYSRVRVSLARKDDLLEELTNDHKALKEKCIYLENIIKQQRKELMINS
ncbi:hypothetical protein WA026_001730 [Henosepilachna vigintioctopunctata]